MRFKSEKDPELPAQAGRSGSFHSQRGQLSSFSIKYSREEKSTKKRTVSS